MSNNPRGYAYQQARTNFLNTHPPVCHWCGRTVYKDAPPTYPLKATIDHLSEVHRAPHLALDTTHWVIACRRCNTSRGATYRNTKPTRRTW